MKLLTLEDYQKAGETFWPKYWYVAKELGEDAKAEDILKVLESIGAVALRLKLEEKEGPFGFNKKEEEDTDRETEIAFGSSYEEDIDKIIEEENKEEDK